MSILIKGLIFGIVILLPGISGGTFLLILGLYEKLMEDISKFNYKPYLPFILGTLAGIYVSSIFLGAFFSSYQNVTLALLLGCILASIRAVLNGCYKPDLIRISFLFGGFLIGILSVGEPFELAHNNAIPNWMVLFISGALASAAMILPGVPGSSIMILFGTYDDILIYLQTLNIIPLLVYLVGGILGIMSLAKLMDNMYKKYHTSLCYLFVGIIIGSSKVVLPSSISVSVVLAFLVGFTLTWIFGKDKAKESVAMENS